MYGFSSLVLSIHSPHIWMHSTLSACTHSIALYVLLKEAASALCGLRLNIILQDACLGE